MPSFVTPDGVKLNYDQRGKGKPLLFLHGWATCSRVWQFQLEWFGRDYHTFALDLRGHGESGYAEGEYSLLQLSRDVSSFIEHTRLKDITLVGWSLGVSLILKLLGEGLVGIDSVVLVDGTPVFVSRQNFTHGLSPAVVRRMLKLLRTDFNRALSEFHNLLLSAEEKEREGKGIVWDLLTNIHYLPHQDAAFKLLQAYVAEDLRGEIKNVEVPTLVVHGGKDRICPPGAAYYFKEHLSEAELLMFPEAGHAPFLTCVETFNRKLSDFLCSL